LGDVLVEREFEIQSVDGLRSKKDEESATKEHLPGQLRRRRGKKKKERGKGEEEEKE
jgi:hypothetical protein